MSRETVAERGDQCRHDALFTSQSARFKVRSDKKISPVNAVVRKWLVQNDKIGQQSRQRKKVLIGLEDECLGNGQDLLCDLRTQRQPTRSQIRSAEAKDLRGMNSREAQTL